jgi:Fe-Mn family superoxide dismutase
MLEDIITIPYWKSMAPNTGGKPIDTLAAAISKDFGLYENFVTTLKVKQLNSLVSWFGWSLINQENYK